MEYPQRKPTRIPGYDYATQNYYFVTICTHEKKCIFGQPENLSEIGRIAAQCIEKIPLHYPNVRVEKFVVMPNHIHGIFVLERENGGKELPNLTAVVGGYKSAVTKHAHRIEGNVSVWQRSFHDHVIRNQASFEKIWNYIEGNPYKWEDDCFFPKK